MRSSSVVEKSGKEYEGEEERGKKRRREKMGKPIDELKKEKEKERKGRDGAAGEVEERRRRRGRNQSGIQAASQPASPSVKPSRLVLRRSFAHLLARYSVC